MECVRGIGETLGRVAAWLCFVKMRMEDDLRALPRGPSHGFGIAPPFMADRDAERQRAGLKYPPARTERIRSLLRRVDLDLVLKTRGRAIPVDDQRGGEQSVACKSLGTENNRNASLCRSRRDG